MSNNSTPPRIEREANMEAKRMWSDPLHPQAIRQREYFVAAYLAGAKSAANRAAPVVKALEEAMTHIPSIQYDLAVRIEKILQTYKADV